MSIFKDLRDAEAQVAQIKAEINAKLAKRVLALPDNPNIERKGKNMFIMQSSALDTSLGLCPFTYDYRAQYRFVVDQFEGKTVGACLQFLRELIKTGRYRETSGASYTKRFHPDVLRELALLLGEDAG